MNKKDLATSGLVYYKEMLNQIKLQRPVAFHLAYEIENTGLYFAYQNETLLYIGIATQSLKISLREMANGYREHPLNQQLLLKLIEKMNGRKIQLPETAEGKNLKEQAILSSSKLNFLQTCVNVRIKSNLKFKFLELPMEDTQILKEYAIKLLKPEFIENTP